VRIAEASLIPYRLPLRRSWRSARGVFSYRCGWLVRLKSDEGLEGYGDCAPLPEAGTESADSALAQLELGLPLLRGVLLEKALESLSLSSLFARPATRCALETALLDMMAQQAALPLARWLNLDARLSVKANQAIGNLDGTEGRRARVAAAAGFSVLKLKVGLNTPEKELAHLRRLSATLPPAVFLRLDANGAWNPVQARQFINGLSGLPVESLEEPLRDPRAASLRELQSQAVFPLALDESLARTGTENPLAERAVRRLVLKPMVLGGLFPALALARRAQDAGLECVVTTTVDSAVGVLAATHLAAALANGLTHGVATSSWLRRDVGVFPPVRAGAIELDNSNSGLGLSMATDGQKLPSHKWA
jgi:o-succinylbenzoate synthase